MRLTARPTAAAGPGTSVPGPAARTPIVRLLALLAAGALAVPGAGPTPSGAVEAASPRSTAAQVDSPDSRFGIHLVRPGDTLFSLALRYQMSVDELATLNAMSPRATLLAGRGLRVPLVQAANARAAEPAGAPAGEAGATAVAAALASGHDDRAGSGDEQTIVVQPGDTLYGIAERFGTDIETLKAANGLPFDGSIRAGEVLIVRGGTVPKPVDGSPATPATGPAAAIGSGISGSEGATSVEVIVAPGDTLTTIAERHGTTAAHLARLNDIAADALAAGQRLKVPRPGSGIVGRGGAKRIEVDVSEQRMYVWEGGELVYNWTASTGMAGYATRRGTFAVQSRIPNAWSSAWQLWMPNWLGIYWAGGSENGIHALPIINGTRIWGGVLGTPISYGCVVIGTDESRLLFNWAEIGTPVIIRD